MSRRNTRLSGHALLREGEGYRVDGCLTCRPSHPDLTFGGVYALYGGHGRCSCGDASPCLNSRGARKRWHAAHKDEVRELLSALGDGP